MKLPDPSGKPGGTWAGTRGDSIFTHHGESLKNRMFRLGWRRDIEYKHGYAHFAPFAKRQADGNVYEVTIAYTGKRSSDYTAAKNALMKTYGLSAKEAKRIMKNQSWHHTENVWKDTDGVFRGTMMLVDNKIHKLFRHNGGFDIHQNYLKTGQIHI